MATTPSSTSPEVGGPRSAGPSPDDLRERLAGYVPRQRSTVGLRRAAVLVPILVSADRSAVSPSAAVPRLDVLFLLRPTTLSSHSGQVAFPGGGIDEHDSDPVAAALREAEEELGIPRALPMVIGQLDEMNTHTGFHVTPVVALLPTPLVIVPSPAEVAAHFEVPLATLCDPRERRTLRGISRSANMVPKTEVRLHFWVNTPAPIWGVTGLILDNLLRVAAQP